MRTIRAALQMLSPRERVVFWAAVMVIVFTGSTSIGWYILAHTHVIPSKGGTFREGMVGQPTVVNPVLAANEVDQTLVRLTFAPLSELADKIETDTPSVAKKWRVRLKEGLSWQDGQKITADDIVFTVMKIQDPSELSPLFAAWRGVTVERISELEVSFTIPAPYAFFPDQVRALMPVPKHIFADVPLANWRLSSYALKPVGSGPFRAEKMDQRSDGFITRYTLGANDRYVRGAPMIANFELRLFPNSEDLVQGFNRGDVDAWVADDAASLGRIDRAHADSAIRLPSYYAVFFNPAQGDTLKERVVREALMSAVNRTALIQVADSGQGTPAGGPVPPGFPGALEVSTSSPQTQTIGQTLDQAGWSMGTSTTRVKINSGGTTPLSFVLTAPNTVLMKRIAEELVRQWAQIGVTVKLNLRDPQIIQSEVIKNRDYEALLFGNTLVPSQDLLPFWYSTERFYPGQNLALYTNRTVDGLIDTARRSSDPDVRERALREAEREILADTPAIFLFAPEYTYVHSPKVQGIKGGTWNELSERFQNVRDWYVETTRVLGE